MELSAKINGCLAIEQGTASIYSTFMRMFPNEKEFWEDLVKDEADHFAVFKDPDFFKVLSKLPEEAQPPPMPYIEKTLEFIKSMRKHIMLSSISLEDALNIALKLEESLVETYMNELIADFKSDSNESYFTLEKMLAEERGHITKVRNMMMKNGYLKIS
jgi:rubrerythrin